MKIAAIGFFFSLVIERRSRKYPEKDKIIAGTSLLPSVRSK
jgi:hypothetical protein